MDWSLMNEGVDQVSLPAPERRMIDRTHFIEISYKQHDDGRIERICRKGEITQKEKKISRAAIERQRNFVKFGAVAGKVGPEKGITETRQQEFSVLWEGLSKQEEKNRLKEKQNAAMNREKDDKKIQEMAMNNQRIRPDESQNIINNTNKARGYVAPGLRQRGDAGYKASFEEKEEEQFEIRISNIPLSTERDDIRELMETFFQNEYHSKSYKEKEFLRKESGEFDISPPRGRYRVSLFSTGRGEERVFNAAVDVKSKYWQTKAIELLDGQAYGYSILKVEKSKPRRRRW